MAVLTGLPAGLRLDRTAIDADLRRRQLGYGRSPRQQLETDTVEVLSGLRKALTLGTPLTLIVRNLDHKNWTWGMSPWEPEGEPQGKGTKPVTLPRPGHADLAGVLKYGHDDVRNALERASARHTATHVADDKSGAACRASVPGAGRRGLRPCRSRAAGGGCVRAELPPPQVGIDRGAVEPKARGQPGEHGHERGP